jgi:NDP-sugar pyrophosphorylase family protein
LESKTNKHDATGFYIDWLRKKVTVKAFVFKGKWYDIGHRDFYQKARLDFSSDSSKKNPKKT